MKIDSGNSISGSNTSRGKPKPKSTFVLRGRRGTYGTGLALVAPWARLVASDAAVLCVAGVALGDMAGVALAAPGWIWRRAWAGLVAADAAALCVAGVASTFASRGRRGTW